MAKRAAYFLLRADYFGRPLDDGVFRALLDNDFEIDVFAPGSPPEQALYPDSIRRHDVVYDKRWLRSQLGRRRWREYDAFLATADLPMAYAGILAALARRPALLVCDEVFVGGYKGAALGRWRTAARWAMRRALATIITDACRIPLQREFARLPESHRFLEYPCCYADAPVELDREKARARLGIAQDEFVLSFAGRPTDGTGLDWALRLLDKLDEGCRLLVQTAGPPEPTLDAALHSLDGAGRILYRPERLEFRESLALTVAADAALVAYSNPKPQFQRMGASSHKLCLSLWLGIPVVATRQPSFSFVEDLGAGVLIEEEGELEAAIRRLRNDPSGFRAGASRATKEHIRAAARLAELTEGLANLL